LSVGTTRLLKSVLPSNCLWTSLHDKEGYDLSQTQTELRNMFAGEDSMAQDDTPAGLPEQIVQMYDDPDVMVALGGMIW
jgi:DNA mismatch repair protein MSH6